MSATDQNKVVPNKVLVTGASGLLGVAAIERFLAAGWEVVGVSRRKPELPSGRKIDFLSVDLRDEEKARAAFEPLTDITHIAYTALYEKPELVAGWSSKEQIDTNNAMLRNVVEPIVRTASNLQKHHYRKSAGFMRSSSATASSEAGIGEPGARRATVGSC